MIEMEILNSSLFLPFLEKTDAQIFISSASFEERCFIIPKLVAPNLADKASAIIFYNGNEVSSIVENSKIVASYFKDNAGLVELDSDLPIKVFENILNTIQIQLESVSKPNLLIDITTFTHEALLILIRILQFKRSEFGTISVCYVGAAEYSINVKDDKKKWLSKGIKQIRSVVGYSGYTDPTLLNHLIVLFGFESDRTRKLIEEYEYDLISLGFADIENSIQTNHQKINAERHQELLKLFPNARKFQFSLRSPEIAKSQILNYIKDNGFSEYNTVVAPLNNKVSTIGAGLAAIENTDIQLAYAKPMLYNVEGYSKPNDDIYVGRILD